MSCCSGGSGLQPNERHGAAGRGTPVVRTLSWRESMRRLLSMVEELPHS